MPSDQGGERNEIIHFTQEVQVTAGDVNVQGNGSGQRGMVRGQMFQYP